MKKAFVDLIGGLSLMVLLSFIASLFGSMNSALADDCAGRYGWRYREANEKLENLPVQAAGIIPLITYFPFLYPYYSVQGNEALEMLHLIQEAQFYGKYDSQHPTLDRLYAGVRDSVPTLAETDLASLLNHAEQVGILCAPRWVDFNDLKRWIRNGSLQRSLAQMTNAAGATPASATTSSSAKAVPTTNVAATSNETTQTGLRCL